jgi:hypothetical protein
MYVALFVSFNLMLIWGPILLPGLPFRTRKGVGITGTVVCFLYFVDDVQLIGEERMPRHMMLKPFSYGRSQRDAIHPLPQENDVVCLFV